MKIYLASLGCKLNQAEIESLARPINASGHHVVSAPEDADWAIINTCTVTHVAARKSRQLIRHLGRRNPALRLAVTGCHAELCGAEVQALPGVALVVPNTLKEQVFDLLLGAAGEARLPPSHATEAHRLQGGHTRAMVKIQDGCDHRCAYCVVTAARGPSVSQAPEDVLSVCERRVAEGYQEIVLTGVNIGAYGRDLAPCGPLVGEGSWSLARLVQAVLESAPVPRLRLSSIEPQDVTPELLALWENARVCRHVHLPLQSGCDATLRRMGRLYTTDQFAHVVQAIRSRMPRVSVTTDVIVGFPGETEAEFEASHAFIERMAFARLHVFTYSSRPGTAAAAMTPMVDPRVAQERSQRLIALGHRLAQAFHARHVGERVEVLFEAPQRTHGELVWSGLTDNYVRVSAPSDQDLANRVGWVRCLRADEHGVAGELERIEVRDRQGGP